MKRINVVTLLAIVALGTTMMYGQASRTWVSGVGDDANPCSRTAPCKTFAGAISKTAAGGEIDALDPAGYGAVTITKAITIDGGGGQVASVLVAGTNGIVVQAGPSDVVILRNLRINGISSGINGIRFLSGKDLNVENCYIFGFTNNGIDIALGATGSSVHIVGSVIKNNNQDGVRAANTAGLVQVGIDRTRVILNGTNGIEAAQHAHIALNQSFVENAGSSGLAAGDATSSDAQITVDHTDVSFNNNGITATAGGSIAVADSKIAFNTGTAMNQSGGTISSFQAGTAGTNRIHSNGSQGTFGTATQQ